MYPINVKSEIGPLKKVMLHRPGREIEKLTPDTLRHLLFDDIPYLRIAQEEHDAFADLLRSHGVGVVYLEQLMAEVLEQSDEIRDQFLMQWIHEAAISTERWQQRIYEHMLQYADNPLELVESGWSVSQQGYVSYAFALRNTSTTLQVQYPEVAITGEPKTAPSCSRRRKH